MNGGDRRKSARTTGQRPRAGGGRARLTAVIAAVLLVRLVGVPAFGEDLRASAARTAREAGLQGDASGTPARTRPRPGLVWTAFGLGVGGASVLLASGLECGSARQCRNARRAGAAMLASALTLAVIAPHVRVPVEPDVPDDEKCPPGCTGVRTTASASQTEPRMEPRAESRLGTDIQMMEVTTGSGLVFRPGGFSVRKTIRF